MRQRPRESGHQPPVEAFAGTSALEEFRQRIEQERGGREVLGDRLGWKKIKKSKRYARIPLPHLVLCIKVIT